MATRGIIALIPSALPLFDESVISVSHALYAASFALEPKKVITQSIIITSVIQTALTDAAGKSFPITSTLINANESMDVSVALVEDLSMWQFEKNTLSETGEKSEVQTKRLYNIAESFIQSVSEWM